MKKLILLFLMTTLLCFSACGTDSGFKPSDLSSSVDNSATQSTNSIVYCYGDPYYETATSTFYAKILDINGRSFHVEGLEINDINFRSEFTFQVKDETRLYWRGIVPQLTDFQEGDNIAITFSGTVLETFPGQLKDVYLIKALDDDFSPSGETKYCYEDSYYETATITFYAEIIQVNGNFFHIKGVDENDINYRSEFTFNITDETRLFKTGIVPPLTAFTKGDIISVTFNGEIQESFPAQIKDVELIKLLHDN